jgi:hypothetical protein
VRSITQREIADLEKRHKQNVDVIAKNLSSRTGIHHSGIREKIHEAIENIPMEKRLKLKMHMLRIGAPAFAVMALESTAITGGGVSSGAVPPEVLWITAVAGYVGGYIMSMKYARHLKQIEAEHARKVTGGVRSII